MADNDVLRRALNEGVVLETSDGLGPDGAHFGTAFERVERRPELRHHRGMVAPSERGAREVYSWAVE